MSLCCIFTLIRCGPCFAAAGHGLSGNRTVGVEREGKYTRENNVITLAETSAWCDERRAACASLL